jgi:hypothetical protein
MYDDMYEYGEMKIFETQGIPQLCGVAVPPSLVPPPALLAARALCPYTPSITS